jgi:glycosyltransferase EpsE
VSERRPEVSVLMAVRNAEHLVDQQIACVLSQRGVSLELLICDDASTDGTGARLAAWRSDPRVRLLRNRRRLFPAATRNRLLALARGRYCSPCDADDLLLPGTLAALAAALRSAPHAGVARASVLQVFVEHRRPPRVIRVDSRNRGSVVTGPVNHPASLIRTRLLRAIGGYAEHLRFAEDWDLMLRLRQRTEFASADGRLGAVWRLQPRSRSRAVRGRAREARGILLSALAPPHAQRRLSGAR